MKNNNMFKLEEQFNYKGLNCYVGFHRLGHRIAGIEIEFSKTNLNKSDLEDLINCDCIIKSNEEDVFLIENDFDHIHNLYDIKGYKLI